MNHTLFSVVFLISFISALNGYAQSALPGNIDIPREYQAQFKVDDKKYQEVTNPYTQRSGQALNLLNAAIKGHLNYNIDSLSAVDDSLHQAALLRNVKKISHALASNL